MRARSAVGTIALLAACASTPPPSDPPPAPAVAPTAPTRDDRAPPKSAPTARRPPDPDAAVELDLEVLQFAAYREQLFRELAPSRSRAAWPQGIVSAWARLIASLEQRLARPPGDFPVPLVLRTRVALDTELDRTRERYGAAPGPLLARFDRACALLTIHLRSPESPRADSPAPEIRLSWPLRRMLITSPFGRRQDPVAAEGFVGKHAGIDLAGARGDPVLAAAPGRVSQAGWIGGGGNAVVIRHVAGYVSMYLHLQDASVAPGQWVETGAPIGYLGSTGVRVTGPHLHFEVRKHGVPVDPEALFERPAR